MAVRLYKIERQKDNGAWEQVAITPDLTYEDTVPTDGVQIRYRALAIDDQGAEGPYVTGPYKAIDYNNAPTITGEDADLGIVASDAPSYEYSVDDIDAADEVAVTELLDGVMLRRYTAVKGETQTLEIPSDVWLRTLNGPHTLVVQATDGKDITERTLTFTRRNTRYHVMTAQPTNGRAAAITLTLIPHPTSMPLDTMLTVRACNDAYAENPTWEIVPTSLVNAGWFTFTNTSNGAPEELGVGIEIIAEEGPSGEAIKLERMNVYMQ